MTGRKGMVGIVTFMGDAVMAKRAVVQTAGQAYVMKAKDIMKHLEDSADFQDICMSYTQTLIAQISQSAICNGLHSIDQRLCRYLLVVSDNMQSLEFTMLQSSISDVLGVRRESVSLAAAQLKSSGLIKYGRGKITILDQEGMLAKVCECYASFNEQYHRILARYSDEHNA
jgi:CRP-like cAMP-binding protein